MLKKSKNPPIGGFLVVSVGIIPVLPVWGGARNTRQCIVVGIPGWGVQQTIKLKMFLLKKV
jgi:hypothetical protein